MAVNGAELVMLTDARLSSDARVLGLYVASKGKGTHEIPREEFADVLSSDAGKERVQRAVGQLERFAWVLRSPGGRGHADSYEFRSRENRTLKPVSGSVQPPLSEIKGPGIPAAKGSLGAGIPPLNSASPPSPLQSPSLLTANGINPPLKGCPPLFTKFWERYPKRLGGNSKAKALEAWHGRMREHVDPAAIYAGLERYTNHLEAMDRIGTEFVKMGATFLSKRDRWWEETWELPALDNSRSPKFEYNNATTEFKGFTK